MKTKVLCIALALAVSGSGAWADQAQERSATAPGATDLYHVMFVKASPGQASALVKDLQEQDPKDPMAGHSLLLRHVEGDDWDYCLIQHLGAKSTVDIPPLPPQERMMRRAWHDDTFAAGPSWGEFQKAMGLAQGGSTHAVYVVGVHRSVPGHREQLAKLLGTPDPAAKVSIGHVTLNHVEGANWQLLSLDRYNSWPDFAADRAANAGAGEGWLEAREHSAFHRDTLAQRVSGQ